MLIILDMLNICWFSGDDVELSILDKMLPQGSKEAKEAGCLCRMLGTPLRVNFIKLSLSMNGFLYNNHCPIHPVARHVGIVEEYSIVPDHYCGDTWNADEIVTLVVSITQSIKDIEPPILLSADGIRVGRRRERYLFPVHTNRQTDTSFQYEILKLSWSPP